MASNRHQEDRHGQFPWQHGGASMGCGKRPSSTVAPCQNIATLRLHVALTAMRFMVPINAPLAAPIMRAAAHTIPFCHGPAPFPPAGPTKKNAQSACLFPHRIIRLRAHRDFRWLF